LAAWTRHGRRRQACRTSRRTTCAAPL